MALQDLTPQLRTRLGRVEKAVGWFVLLATLLLAAGFVYYLWHTAQRRGWFVEKVECSTGLNTATGIKAGDPVKLMGFPIGEVTRVIPNDPEAYYNVTVFFEIRRDTNNYCGYIWSDSKVKIASSDFMGNRTLELVKGRTGIPLLKLENSNDPHSKIIGVFDKKAYTEITKSINQILIYGRDKGSPLEAEITNRLQQVEADAPKYARWWNCDLAAATEALVIQQLNKANPDRFYQPFSKGKNVFIRPDESPALTERLEKVVGQAEKALPDILGLTNQIVRVLDNAVRLTSNLDATVTDARPAVTNANALLANARGVINDLKPVLSNLTFISTTLTNSKGSLGEWLIPTNLNQEIETALKNANTTLATANATISHTDTNLTALMDNVGRSLDGLAGITSNLNRQVEANTNILSDISSLIRNTDTLVQGLRRHWLLRSAFKTNAPPSKPTPEKKGGELLQRPPIRK